MQQSGTIAEQLRTKMEDYTPSERKIVRVLLSNYPMAGLETIAQLAAKAHVSGPSVLRLVTRLGFENYGSFQAALRDELEVRLQSPLARHSSPLDNISDNDFLAHFVKNLHHLLQETISHIPRSEFDSVVEILCDIRKPVWLLGGRLTRPLAEIFTNHLKSMRPNVHLMPSHPSSWPNALADMNKGHTLVIFDIRRYSEEAAHLADMAAQRKVNIVLFTDQWHSPITRVANHIFPAHLAHASSWDANSPLMMLIDAVIFAMSRKNWDNARHRLEDIENIRATLSDKIQNTAKNKAL